MGLRIRLAMLLRRGIHKESTCSGYRASLNSDYLIDGIQILLDSYDEVYEHVCHSALQPGAQVVDVGCNIGLTIFMACQATQGQTHVLGWEADPEQFRRCQHNLSLNPSLQEWVRVDNLALSDQDGLIRFRSVAAEQGNYLVDPQGPVSMQCRSLDSLLHQHKLERLDLIKCDIDGHEQAFFKGAQASLSRFRPLVFFESILLPPYQPEQPPWKQLRDLNYTLFDARYPHAPLEPGQSPCLDTLACPDFRWGELHPKLAALGARASRARSLIRRMVDAWRYQE